MTTQNQSNLFATENSTDATFLEAEFENQEPKITAKRVPDRSRIGFFPKFLGRNYRTQQYLKKHGSLTEFVFYDWLKAHCINNPLHSGYWEFYSLSNGSAYIAPSISSDERLNILIGSNFADVSVSPDAAGIITSSFVLNMLANLDLPDESHPDYEIQARTRDDMIEKYYGLLDYARAHPERNAIFRAID